MRANKVWSLPCNQAFPRQSAVSTASATAHTHNAEQGAHHTNPGTRVELGAALAHKDVARLHKLRTEEGKTRSEWGAVR